MLADLSVTDSPEVLRELRLRAKKSIQHARESADEDIRRWGDHVKVEFVIWVSRTSPADASLRLEVVELVAARRAAQQLLTRDASEEA